VAVFAEPNHRQIDRAGSELVADSPADRSRISIAIAEMVAFDASGLN
jgi:hypothetical protein